MFENLNVRNAAGYAIHVSGQKVQVIEAVKLLTQETQESGTNATTVSVKSEES